MIFPAVCIVSKSCSLDYLSHDVHYILWPMFVNVRPVIVSFFSSISKFISSLLFSTSLRPVVCRVLLTHRSSRRRAAASENQQSDSVYDSAKFHYIKTVSGKVVAHSVAFRVVSIYWQGDDPEILPPSDLPSPVSGIIWEMSELITQERIAVGSSNFVEGLIT